MLIAGGATVAAWRARSPDLPPIPPRPVLTGDAGVVERFQCYRCHRAPDHLVPTSREGSCVDCHRAIRAGELEGYDEERLTRWREHATSLIAAPSLDGLALRYRRSWFVSFLQAPHDLRPSLPASMPRLRIGPEDAEAIARHFGLVDSPAPDGVDGHLDSSIERGRATFLAGGCPTCHAFSGAGTPPPLPVDLHDATQDARILAPDLRITRDRMTRESALAWLADPRALDRGAQMPTPDLTAAERSDVVAFLFDTPLDSHPPSHPPPHLPLLTRRVTHAEVDAAVFHRTCRHCHADPIPMDGEGGPGNTGGFGFAARGLDLSTYEAIDRERDELFAPEPDGTPLLIAALRRRHDEVGGILAERRGMPLGLPPISPEALQLVETWVAQGAPRD